MASLSELREGKFLAALEAHFPGSTWDEDVSPPSASTSSGDRVDSVQAQCPPDALPSSPSDAGGTEGYAVIIGSKYDPVAVRKFAEGLPHGTKVVCGSPRVSKKGVPMNGEAVLIEAGDAEEIPWGEDYLGDKYRNLQPGLLVATADVYDLTVVLIGTGKKIDDAKKVLLIFGDEAPPVIEISYDLSTEATI